MQYAASSSHLSGGSTPEFNSSRLTSVAVDKTFWQQHNCPCMPVILYGDLYAFLFFSAVCDFFPCKPNSKEKSTCANINNGGCGESNGS
jgi:hypothetical protein